MSVYVVRAPLLRRVKIGYAADVPKRLASLQTSSPERLHLVRAWPGEVHHEQEAHHRFRAWRLHGEWFREAGRVVDLCRLAEVDEHCLPPWDAAWERSVFCVLCYDVPLSNFRKTVGRFPDLLSALGRADVAACAVHKSCVWDLIHQLLPGLYLRDSRQELPAATSVRQGIAAWAAVVESASEECRDAMSKQLRQYVDAAARGAAR